MPIKIHIPIKKQTGRQLPQHILTDIKTKRRLRKQLQRTHCIQLKQQLTSEINRLHKNITLQIKNFDNQRIQSFLQSIPQENEQPGTFYKKVRSHTKQHKSYTTLKDSNGNSITSHQNISNTFASLLQQKMDVHTDFYDRDFQTRVDSAIDSQRYLFEPLSCDAEYCGDASGITADIDIHDVMSTLERSSPTLPLVLTRFPTLSLNIFLLVFLTGWLLFSTLLSVLVTPFYLEIWSHCYAS